MLSKYYRRYTNHSLRATGASELFQSETPEHVIQQFTGYRSIQALCQYENISTKQKQAACNILTGSSGQRFSSEVQKTIGMQQSSSCVAPYSNAFTIPTISPVINGANTINFTVNICPPQSMVTETSKPVVTETSQPMVTEESHYDNLLKDLDLDDFF